MYFYKIKVYYPFGKTNYTIMSHDHCFDNHQLNTIAQQAFDECIEKYTNKTILDEGEEPCRMTIETIFEKYLPTQLQNHGFNNIKIDETYSIMDGELFTNGGAINNVLQNRYKDKALPPCKKYIKGEYDECTIPNIRKYNNLATPHVVKTIPIDLNEDDFNVSVVKQYFVNSHKSSDDAKIVYAALENILDDNDFDNYYLERGKRVDGIYTGDIVCGLDIYEDKEKCKKTIRRLWFYP